jgi:hypothetical protein
MKIDLPNKDFKNFVLNNFSKELITYDIALSKLRDKRWYETCYELGKIAEEIFPESPIIQYNQSIVCYYLNLKIEGMRYCDKLLFNYNTPSNIIPSVYNNQEFYIDSPFFDRKRLFIPVLYPYRPMNLNIRRLNNKEYEGILRTVNYFIEKDGTFRFEGYLQTESHYVIFNQNFNVTKYIKLKNNSDTKKYTVGILGFEDCRFFRDNSFVCSCAEFNEKGIPNITYCEFDKMTGLVEKTIPLKLYDDNRCEKNWIPIPIQSYDQLFFVYQFSPFTIIGIDKKSTDGNCYIKNMWNWSINFNGLRGSTNFIEYKSGWLILLHYSNDKAPRHYFHRLCWFDNKFEKGKISTSLIFEKKQIEYCIGMEFCEDNNYLIFSYTIWDDKTSICKLETAKLDNLLEFPFQRKNN